MSSQQICRSLRNSVLTGLGIQTPPATDLDGLRALYAAWCAHVPFDNVRKMVALRTGQRLPGTEADDFFENWLAHGAGGTCWASSNALYTLFRSVGFEVERITGSMRDMDMPNHGSVRATVDGRTWIVDSSVLSNVPLPLGDELFIVDDPVFVVEVEKLDTGEHRLWFELPPHSTYFPCRFFLDEVSHAFYRERYELTRERSLFNDRLYVRRNRPGEMLVLVGNSRFRKTEAGVEKVDLGEEELLRCLREEIGLSQKLVEAWAACGALMASFEPPSGPPPPPITGLPPSQRQSPF